MKVLEQYHKDMLERGRKYSKTPKGIYKILARRCRLNGYELLSQADFLEWYKYAVKACVYCHVPESDLSPFKIKGKVVERLTIERLDNERGYTRDNIALACCICNTTRSDIFTSEQMEEIGKVILDIWQK